MVAPRAHWKRHSDVWAAAAISEHVSTHDQRVPSNLCIAYRLIELRAIKNQTILRLLFGDNVCRVAYVMHVYH